MTESRLAVIDCGSNSFRLVVFTYTDTWWKRTDEIHEAVRVGEGLEALRRRCSPSRWSARWRRSSSTRTSATPPGSTRSARWRPRRSATRPTRRSSSKAARKRSGLEVEVLPGPAEARYGYLAAVNSTTLADGVVLDLGGGSMQLTRVDGARGGRRALVAARRRAHDRALRARQEEADEGAARARRAGARERASGSATTAGSSAIGGTVRNLAAAAQLAAGLPSYGIQGYCVTREALGELIDEFTDMSPRRARRRAGHQGLARRPDPGRRAGHRRRHGGGRLRGVRGDRGRPARGRVLRAPVRRRRCRATSAATPCATSPPSTTPTSRTPSTSPGSRWRCGTRSPPPACTTATAEERELLWATAMLHDIGVAVDYDDHHKHSRYLILNAGLPGFSPRETALIGQAARYHRKGIADPGRVRAASRARATPPCSTASPRPCASPSSSSARATSPCTPATSTCTTGRVELRLHADRGRPHRPLGRRASGRPVRARVRPRASGNVA